MYPQVSSNISLSTGGNSKAKSTPIMNRAKIIIVGTGPSGIAAATKLLELGFQKVYLVEAENRIGGRIRTVPYGDNVVDLGAQWCHGEKGNVVFDLAYPLNLLERTGDKSLNFENIRSNRVKVSAEVNKLLKNITDEIAEERNQSLSGYRGSFGSYITRKFFEALKEPKYSGIDLEVAKEYLEAYKKMECSAIACDTVDDASGQGQLEYWDCEGDPNLNWKDKGYQTFLNLLLKSEEKGTEFGVLEQRVMLNKRVNTIVRNEGEQVKLICEDGDELLADHVIVTVSLGVLKEKHTTLFKPNLPPKKVRAIEGLGFGTVNKVILEFSSQFWPEDWAGFVLLWREEDLKEIRGTNLAWLEDLFVFDTAAYKPRVLFGWIVGPGARRMEELSEGEVLSGCMYLLRRFLPWEIPYPSKFIHSTWHSNENFRGSYSFRSMLTDEMNTGAVDLTNPLRNDAGKPVVLFAGEASNEHHFSTVHGAVETGWREAERLYKFYKRINPRKCLI